MTRLKELMEYLFSSTALYEEKEKEELREYIRLYEEGKITKDKLKEIILRGKKHTFNKLIRKSKFFPIAAYIIKELYKELGEKYGRKTPNL